MQNVIATVYTSTHEVYQKALIHLLENLDLVVQFSTGAREYSLQAMATNRGQVAIEINKEIYCKLFDAVGERHYQELDRGLKPYGIDRAAIRTTKELVDKLFEKAKEQAQQAGK